MSEVSFLVLDAKEEIELLELSTGWADEESWGTVDVQPGMYLVEVAANPLRPDQGKWFFVKGSRVGQTLGWLAERQLVGVDVSIGEATNVPAPSTQEVQGETSGAAANQGSPAPPLQALISQATV